MSDEPTVRTAPVHPHPMGQEPTEEEIRRLMESTGENYYNARERLREAAYGGKPPHGYRSWGDYWKV